METLEELQRKFADRAADDAALMVEVNDLIERREQTARASLLADCRVDVARAGQVEHFTLTHLPTGRAVAGATQDEALTALRKALVSPSGDHPEDRPFGDVPTVVQVEIRR